MSTQAIAEILEQSSSRESTAGGSQYYQQKVHEQQETPEPKKHLPSVCDASIHYDLSHIVQPEEHSYSLRTSSPIHAPSSHHPLTFVPWLITPDVESTSDSCTESEEEPLHLTDSDRDEEKPCDMDIADTSFASTESNTALPHEEEPKYIVFSSCLHELLRYCPSYGSVVYNVSESNHGSMLTVKLVCSKGHTVSWHSQAMVNDMPAGNLLTAAAILLSGGSYNKISQFCRSS